MDDIFFESWKAVGRVVIISSLAYIYLVFILRATGKRTLSKMNAFDLIVTVAFGSTLAATILNKNVALAEGMMGLTMLTLLQYVLTWLSVRSKKISSLVKSNPQFLYYQDHYLEDALRNERVVKEEILAAIRSSGLADLDNVRAVILESDGTFTVIKKKEGASDTAMKEVEK